MRETKASRNLSTAMTAFNTAGIDIHANFHTLSSSQVGVIVELAKDCGYRKPKNANGSTGRYYFAALKRATTAR
jgi:hypothetical protein